MIGGNSGRWGLLPSSTVGFTLCWYSMDLLETSRPMAQRFHLDLMNSPEGTVWFTLVLEEPVRYHVESYTDSRNAYLKERTKYIAPSEFGQYQVNGVPLIKLVENKLQDMVEASWLQGIPIPAYGV